MRKTSKTETIRKYIIKHPNHTAQQVATAVGTTASYVHTVMWKTKNKAAKLAKHVATLKTEPVVAGDHKLVKVFTTDAPIGQSITMQADEVTKLTDEQKSRLIENLGKPRMRMATREEKIVKPGLYEVPATDNVNHPAHYKVGGIETIDFIEAKGFGYNLGNVVKYLARAEHKGNRREDLAKARWYLNREIAKTDE